MKLWEVICTTGLTFSFLNPKVKCDESISGPEEVSGPEQGEVTVTCTYAESYRNNEKYWCAGDVFSSCKVLIKSDFTGRHPTLSIKDDKAKRNVSISVKGLQKQDEGLYWCGISTILKDKHSPVYLKVTAPITKTTPKPKTTTTMTTEHISPTLQWVSTATKGTKMRLATGMSQTHVTVIVFGCLVFLLCCLAAAVAMWRYKDKEKCTPGESFQASEETEMVYSNVVVTTKGNTPEEEQCHYANVKPRRHSQETVNTVVYSTVRHGM